MAGGLHPSLGDVLSVLRQRRGFKASTYLQAKYGLLNDYMRRAKLASVVVGVSGGIDSAVVLGMLVAAARCPGSPIRNIVPVLLPYLKCSGTTNQDGATAFGSEVCAAFGVMPITINLTPTHTELKGTIDRACRLGGSDWASGQLVSYLRTPAFFYVTALMADSGSPGIFIGTTNRDEGGYIGYFGKAADAMVDLQLISDLHKSEVYSLARLLKVPQSVLDAAPTGDIYDGRTDEQLIGVPYDFLELYQLLLCLRDENEQNLLLSGLGTDARQQFEQFSERVVTLNRQNGHKYQGGSPAVHLDVYQRAVPGGWRVEVDPEQIKEPAEPARFVNEFKLDDAIVGKIETRAPYRSPESRAQAQQLDGFAQSALLVQNLLSPAECAEMMDDLGRQNWVPVGIHGMLKDFDPATQPIGSWRASYFSERLARALWNRMAPALDKVRVMDNMTPTDWRGDRVWRAVGISPLMRFIRYTQHGLLVPHYDSPYEHHPSKRTLMSVVVYLTDGGAEDGGATRFIHDPQQHLPLDQRDYSDWTRLARPSEIRASVCPQAGSALVFDHRLLHDSEPIRSTRTKVIMRTNIVFERCGLQLMEHVSASRPLGMPEVASNKGAM